MTEPIVALDNLRKVYSGHSGSIAAIDNLTLELARPGSVHGFLGPNGSGKTTTIRCLLGLIRPTSGSTTVFGVNSQTDLHTVASRIGSVVESPKLFPHFSARRNLSLLADLGGLKQSEVDRSLEVVGLADRANDRFDTFSLGMKQRTAIACALLKNPDLILLDEPANGLDPAGIAEIRVLMRRLADQGSAVLVSSHQLAEVEQVCDDVSIINRGKLIASGTTDEIRNFAGDDTVIVTITERDEATALLNSAGFEARPLPRADQLAVTTHPSKAVEINKLLADSQLYLGGLESKRASLEAAFLNLTGGPPPPTGPSAELAVPPSAASA